MPWTGSPGNRKKNRVTVIVDRGMVFRPITGDRMCRHAPFLDRFTGTASRYILFRPSTVGFSPRFLLEYLLWTSGYQAGTIKVFNKKPKNIWNYVGAI